MTTTNGNAKPIWTSLKRGFPVHLGGKPLCLHVKPDGRICVWLQPDAEHAGDYLLTQNQVEPSFTGYEGRFVHVTSCVSPSLNGTVWHLWRCPPRAGEPETPGKVDQYHEGDREVDARSRTIERRRAVVKACIGKGMTTSKIAETLGFPETTIRSDRRALEKTSQ